VRRAIVDGMVFVVAVLLQCVLLPAAHGQSSSYLRWSELPPLPNRLGVAGPFVGVHGDVLLLAGGANYPEPVWENSKQWQREIYALVPEGDRWKWVGAGQLKRPLAYGASVSTAGGVICIGGNDERNFYAGCFRLRWNTQTKSVEQEVLPSLPVPLAYGQACAIGNRIYVAGGQTNEQLSSAVQALFSLDLSNPESNWQRHSPWPAMPRAFNIAISQNNGFNDCLYLMGGRSQQGGQVQFLSDCWQYNPKTDQWLQRARMPSPLAAGAGIAFGQSHVLVLSGDDGRLFDRADELREQHTGFTPLTWIYHTITDTWTPLDGALANQVTTTAVQFQERIVLPNGETQPRVRTAQVWSIEPKAGRGFFSRLDYVVLALYMASLVLIGIYYASRTRDTEDYFRASGQIPWWAAGCSIFATMLSSLTFTGLPSKAFAQDWVYAVANLMIPVVAVFAVGIALPFYRRIDATSAYEYLEKRFHSSVRTFGSLSFSLFHVFRMAIVMSLTGLALAVATPMTPAQSVVLMGALSIVYCALGGISAVIWTDTLQTAVLLGGALIAIVWMWVDTHESLANTYVEVLQYDKLSLANWHLDPFDAQVALWVVLLGALGQNVASYSADQAVVQRYMTTRTESLAAKAIWTNAILSIPATILFFGIGTGLFVYYRVHPERLDPSITTDQIFPLFISRELPVGLSGLIVAAMFAAAQSTVSTSMNSVATTLVTDCFRPLLRGLSESSFLRLAQLLTVTLGMIGTLVAIAFVDPQIRSLFDQFIKVVGLFMGVLGGLFVLGTLFPRANTCGAWLGAVAGAIATYLVWQFTQLHGFLYSAIGIVTCVLVGSAGSYLMPPPEGVDQLCITRR
jgi:solute:Na+ symporter, SSS family